MDRSLVENAALHPGHQAMLGKGLASHAERAKSDSEVLGHVYKLPATGEAGAHEMKRNDFGYMHFTCCELGEGEFNDCMKVNTASMRNSGIISEQTFSQISESSYPRWKSTLVKYSELYLEALLCIDPRFSALMRLRSIDGHSLSEKISSLPSAIRDVHLNCNPLLAHRICVCSADDS